MQVEDANSDSDQRNHHQLDNEVYGEMIDAEQIDKRANVLATAFQTIIGARQPQQPATQSKAAVSPRAPAQFKNDPFRKKLCHSGDVAKEAKNSMIEASGTAEKLLEIKQRLIERGKGS